jgi:hypothetical protein
MTGILDLAKVKNNPESNLACGGPAGANPPPGYSSALQNMGGDKDMEKRNCTRVIFESESYVLYKDQKLKGTVENLSLNGVLLKVEESIPANENVEVQINLSGSTSRLCINLQGLVVRQDDRGLAIQIIGMDLDSFIHYKNVITYISGNEREIMSEFHKFVARRGREE